MLTLLSNEKVRDRLYQGLALVIVGGLLTFFVVTAHNNLVEQGIASGFGFLRRSTGWDIPFTLIDYSVRDPYWRVLFVGFLNTIFVGLFSLFFATLFGTMIGMARISRNPLLNLLGTAYVETFRNIPLILQGFFWYAVATHLPPPKRAFEFADMAFLTSRGLYLPSLNLPDGGVLFLLCLVALAVIAVVLLRRSPRISGVPRAERGVTWGAVILVLAVTALLVAFGREPGAPVISLPELKGLRFKGGLRIIPEFAALAIAIIVFGSAYVGEIVRGGFQSVGRGQLEAARALGLSPWAVMRKVHIPLALRAIVPPLGNQYVWLMKASTIGIAIGFSDLFMIVSTSINQSGQTIELLFIMMTGFFLINYSISSLMNLVNRSIALKGHEAETKAGAAEL